MNNATLVSAIIPAYNAAAFLAEAVGSVRAQTHRAIEIIVVNDGSTDNTREVVQGLGDGIVYVEQPNSGPAAARNTGIRRARGEFIAFLDADDLWQPTKVEKQLAAFAAHPGAALVYTQMVNFSLERGREPRPFPAEVSSGRIFERLLVENLILLSGAMIRADVLREVGGFDEGLITAEDTNLWLKIARRHEIRGLDEVLVLRRKHGDNISDNLDVPIGTLANLDRIVEMFPDTAPAVNPAMKEAYRARGKALIADYFHGGRYKSCHEVCHRLLGIVGADPTLAVYWGMTLFPAPVVDLLRRVRSRLRTGGA